MSQLYQETTEFVPVQLYPDIGGGIRWSEKPSIDASGNFVGKVEGFIRGTFDAAEGRQINVNSNFTEHQLDILVPSKPGSPTRSNKFRIPRDPSDPTGPNLSARYLWLQCSLYYDLQDRPVITVGLRFQPEWRILSGLQSWYFARSASLAESVPSKQNDSESDDDS